MKFLKNASIERRRFILRIWLKDFLQKFWLKPISVYYLLTWKKPCLCQVNGYKIYLDPADRGSAFFRRAGVWEIPVQRFIKSSKKQYRVIYEFGSAFGFFSFLLARKFKQATVYGFEPFPRYFRHLEKSHAANQPQSANVHFFNLGLGNEGDFFRFKSDDNSYHGLSPVNRIQYHGFGDHNTKRADASAERTVAALHLTQILDKIGASPDLIFCDIEGAEVLLFEQLSQLAPRPDIIWEHHACFYGKDKLRDLMSQLQRLGYQNKPIDRDHLFSEYCAKKLF